MSDLYITGMPGVSAERLAAFKRVFRGYPEYWLSGGKYIDGVYSRDPTNIGNTNVLQPGVVMGKRSTGYAPSIIGLTSLAIANGATTVTAAAATISELSRRIGTSGTFKVTGPPAASGVVRTQTVTYSTLGTTTATITATGANEVQTLSFANSPTGTFSLSIVDLNGVTQVTPPITYSGTAATLVSNINTAITTALGGGSLVVASGSAVTAIALTFSGTGYASLPQSLVTVNTGALTAGNVSITRTTAGSSGAFVVGSFIQPTDGCEVPLTFVGENDGGILVTDINGNNITVPFDKFPIGGEVSATQLVNWPADPSLQTWLMQQLSTAVGGKFTFGEPYTV